MYARIAARVLTAPAQLYTKIYPEMMSKSPTVEAIIRGLWELIGSGQLAGIAYDGLVTQSLRFISVTIRQGHYKQLFSSPDTIRALGEGVVMPNVVLRGTFLSHLLSPSLTLAQRRSSSSSRTIRSSTCASTCSRPSATRSRAGRPLPMCSARSSLRASRRRRPRSRRSGSRRGSRSTRRIRTRGARRTARCTCSPPSRRGAGPRRCVPLFSLLTRADARTARRDGDERARRRGRLLQRARVPGARRERAAGAAGGRAALPAHVPEPAVEGAAARRAPAARAGARGRVCAEHVRRAHDRAHPVHQAGRPAPVRVCAGARGRGADGRAGSTRRTYTTSRRACSTRCSRRSRRAGARRRSRRTTTS
jgi:hypothetical protein